MMFEGSLAKHVIPSKIAKKVFDDYNGSWQHPL